MPVFSPDDYFHEATQRWPAIAWPPEAYLAHLGNETPSHPVDLFLGGAAAHRLDEAWEVIEQELGPETRRILRHQPTADYDLEDLWGDTIIKLMDNDESPSQNAESTENIILPDGRQPARIIRYRGKVKLLHYLILIAKRLAISRQRKLKPVLFLTLVGQDLQNTKDPGGQLADTKTATPDVDAQRNETAQNMIHALAQAWTDLSSQQRFLIRMVYDRGMKQRDAGELLGVSPFKANRLIKKTMSSLQTSLAQAVDEPRSPAFTAAWAGVWAEHWKNIKDDSNDTHRV